MTTGKMGVPVKSLSGRGMSALVVMILTDRKAIVSMRGDVNALQDRSCDTRIITTPAVGIFLRSFDLHVTHASTSYRQNCENRGQTSNQYPSGNILSELLELRPACGRESRQIIAGELPECIGNDFFVVVTENVADTCNFPPWYFRMTFFQVFRQSPACFGRDLKTSLNDPPPIHVCDKVVQRNAFQFSSDVFDCSENVLQRKFWGHFLHQNT